MQNISVAQPQPKLQRTKDWTIIGPIRLGQRFCLISNLILRRLPFRSNQTYAYEIFTTCQAWPAVSILVRNISLAQPQPKLQRTKDGTKKHSLRKEKSVRFEFTHHFETATISSKSNLRL